VFRRWKGRQRGQERKAKSNSRRHYSAGKGDLRFARVSFSPGWTPRSKREKIKRGLMGEIPKWLLRLNGLNKGNGGGGEGKKGIKNAGGCPSLNGPSKVRGRREARCTSESQHYAKTRELRKKSPCGTRATSTTRAKRPIPRDESPSSMRRDSRPIGRKKPDL